MTWEDKMVEMLSSNNPRKIYKAARQIQKNDTGSCSSMEYEMANIICELMYENIKVKETK